MPGRRDGAQPVAERPLPHTIALPARSLRARLLGTAGLVLVVGIPLFLYAPFLDNPFERDEGVYATVAQGLLSGETPYRDLFDNKPPLVYLWYALSFLVFGEEVFAPRLFAAVLLAGTALVVFLQARLLFPLRVAYMSAGLFALAMGIPYVALHANTEALMMLPLMGSLLAFTRGMIRGRLAWFALAGVLAGLALMTKQVAVWNLLTLLVIAPWWRRKQGYTGTEAVLPALWLGAGALAASALVLVPFALSGALDDFFYANVIYNYGYVGVTSYAERIFRMKRALLFALYFLGATAPLVAGSFAGIIASVRKGLSPAYLLAIVWAVASGLGVAMGGRFYPHYFLQLIPSMALLSALALHEHLEALPTRLPGRPLLAAAALLLLVALATNGLLWVAPRTAEERLSDDVYHQKEWEGASREVAEYVVARTAPEEEILNYGREGQLYFYADRLPATRYFYDWAYGYDPGTLSTTIEHLRREPPAFVIDTVLPPLFDATERDPEMEGFLREYYDLAGRVEFADIYSRKEP